MGIEIWMYVPHSLLDLRSVRAGGERPVSEVPVASRRALMSVPDWLAKGSRRSGAGSDLGESITSSVIALSAAAGPGLQAISHGVQGG
jgi:hypothetical protein